MGLAATAGHGRRITATSLLPLVPLVPLVLFGVARAAAPVSLLGVLFDDPWTYASGRRCQGSVIPGRVSDQMTHTAMAINTIDQNG